MPILAYFLGRRWMHFLYFKVVRVYARVNLGLCVARVYARVNLGLYVARVYARVNLGAARSRTARVNSPRARQLSDSNRPKTAQQEFSVETGINLLREDTDRNRPRKKSGWDRDRLKKKMLELFFLTRELFF